MATTKSVLDYLFPGCVERFFAHYPRSPICCDGPLARFPSFVSDLSIASLAEVYRGDVALHSADSRPVTITDPDAGAIAWLAERCDGITFERIERVIPGIADWCRELADLLALPKHVERPRCNAFSSPKSSGYRFHFHYEGALLVQLAGEKRGRLAPVSARFPVVQTDRNERFETGFAVEPRPMAAYAQFAEAGFPAPPDEHEAQEFELSPGSVLYIPPGYWHSTCSLSRHSFAVSMFVATPRLYEGYLRALELALLTESAWREPVAPRDARSHDGLASMRERLARVAARLRTEDIQLCLGEQVELSLQSTLCPNFDVQWSCEPTQEGTAFRIRSDKEYAFEAEPAEAAVLCTLLHRTAPFTLADALRDAQPAASDLVTSAIELLETIGCLVLAPFALAKPAS